MQDNGSFRLIVRRGPQPNQTYELNKDIVTIGRDITNDIVINDPEVSRHHLRFTRGTGSYTIEDLGSTNGTFVNGQRITGAKPLSNGDMIGLGETVTLGYEASRAPSGEAGDEESSAPGPTVESRVPEQPQAQSPYRQPEGPAYAPSSPQPPDQQDDSYNQDAAAYSRSAAPPPQAPPSGYYEEEYEEPEPNNTTRIVLIGCVVLTVFCCCATLVSAFIIDQNCLWYSLPVFETVLDAIGQEPPLSQPACAARYGDGAMNLIAPFLGG